MVDITRSHIEGPRGSSMKMAVVGHKYGFSGEIGKDWLTNLPVSSGVIGL